MLVCSMLAGAAQAAPMWRCTYDFGRITTSGSPCEGQRIIKSERVDPAREPRLDGGGTPGGSYTYDCYFPDGRITSSPDGCPSGMIRVDKNQVHERTKEPEHVEKKKQEIPITYNINDADFAAVRKGIEGILKDPDSAKYGVIGATRLDEFVVNVCGTVNARNGYGGYTGYMRYIGLLINENNGQPSRFDSINLASDGGSTQVITTLCAGRGITFSEK
jgi:hypothetical protein